MKKYLNIWSLGIAIVHFSLSIILTARAIVASLGGIDGIPPTQSERIASLGADILNFPLVTLAVASSLSSKIGAIADLVFILNSLVWGIGIYILGKFIRKVLNQK